ncbi:MAG: restriction endonuclease [Clostridiaceae bacterium]|nr:restriction endonuclease [Clostridiaceae bacterium]
MSDKSKILYYFTRKEADDRIHFFQDLFKRAVTLTLFKSGDELEKYVEVNINRYWNYILRLQQQEKEKGIVPTFNIEDELLKKVSWYTKNKDINIKRKMHLLKARTKILNTIDKFDNRKYEALACVVCKLLGAKNIVLTPSGNEAGIDFMATINFSSNAHYFFGINGPLRIIGQCKKYSSDVQVDSIKEFNSTLLDVFSLTEKVRKVLPNWFITSKGPIIGWFIGHNGFQSGAESRAKNYGIITSDSRDLAELISCSKKFFPLDSPDERSLGLIYEVNQLILDRSINMDINR